jgi:hypothetical protein
MASEGIHEIAVTDDSIRVLATWVTSSLRTISSR